MPLLRILKFKSIISSKLRDATKFAFYLETARNTWNNSANKTQRKLSYISRINPGVYLLLNSRVCL